MTSVLVQLQQAMMILNKWGDRGKLFIMGYRIMKPLQEKLVSQQNYLQTRNGQATIYGIPIDVTQTDEFIILMGEKNVVINGQLYTRIPLPMAPIIETPTVKLIPTPKEDRIFEPGRRKLQFK